MDKIVNYIKSKEYMSDIIYIAIGSTVIRDTKPENMQQFPPWLEKIWLTTNLTITLINIDTKFEQPYTLIKHLNLIKTSSEDVYKQQRLDCIYINYTFDYTNDLCFLDELNRLVIDKNKLLICGDYTGRSNSIMENHFIDLYELEPKYNYGYLINITYNFMVDDSANTCVINLLKNYPLIDLDSHKIVKLLNINIENLGTIIETYNGVLNFKEKMIIKLILMLNNISDNELYLYRNYINKNYQEHMKKIWENSIFNDINITDYTDYSIIIDNMKNKIVIYCLELIKGLEKYIDSTEFNHAKQILPLMPTDKQAIYFYINDYIKTIRILVNIYCYDI
jgi:hypothetical protein